MQVFGCWVRQKQISRKLLKKECLLDILLPKIRFGRLKVRIISSRSIEWREITRSRTSITLKSLMTTVATPLKKSGRLEPSIWWPYPFTSTKAPFCSLIFCVIPEGYISLTDGTKTAEGEFTTSVDPSDLETDAEREDRTCKSWGSVLG